MKKGGSRGLGAVYHRPDSQDWWIRYSVGGVERRESSKSPKHSVATDLLKARLREIADGTYLAPRERGVTVMDLLDDLVADYTMRRLASLRTVRQHRAALLDLDPDTETEKPGPHGLGALPAAALSTARLTRLVTYWQDRDVAPATINKRLGTLRAAYYLGLEADPPKVKRVPKMPKLDELNAREGFFERGEFTAVLAELPDDGLRDFVDWSYWTGMRKGEIAKLTWAAFDRETWTLTLPARSSKTKKPRRLALRGPLRAIIERRVAARRLDCPLIFWRMSDGKPTRVYEFRKAWATACTTAGLSGKLFHDLRRTGVRNLVRAGVTRKVAMKISGHLTEHVFERYNIDTDDDLGEAVEKVAAYVDTLPTSRTVVPIATTGTER